MNRSPLTAAVLVAVALLPAVAPAEDWPRFRGPNGAGVVDGKFAPTISEKDFAWNVELPGKGHASPVVWKDRIYTTSADAEEGKRFVLCLNAKDGGVVWQTTDDFSKFRQHGDNSYASATPAVDDVGVYVTWGTPEKHVLFALDHAGKELWRRDLGAYKSQHGDGASPVVVDDTVILACDQEGPNSLLAGFDRRTGAVRWRLERPSTDKANMSTPAVWQPKGEPPQVVFTGKGYGFTAIDPKTGRVIWEAKGTLDARAVGSPVVAGDLIIGACGDGTSYKKLFAVRPPTKPGGTATTVYMFDQTAPYVVTPIVKGDRLFMWSDAGLVTCVEASTGKEIWSQKAGGMYYGSPVCVGDTLWCMNRKGELAGVRAADTFEQVNPKLPLGEPSHATPAVADGKMYLRTVSHLIRVDLRPAKE